MIRNIRKLKGSDEYYAHLYVTDEGDAFMEAHNILNRRRVPMMEYDFWGACRLRHKKLIQDLSSVYIPRATFEWDNGARMMITLQKGYQFPSAFIILTKKGVGHKRLVRPQTSRKKDSPTECTSS